MTTEWLSLNWPYNLPISLLYALYSSEGNGDREKGPATEIKLEPTLLWSFSHMNHQSWSRYFIPHCPYVLLVGVPLSSVCLRPASQG